MPSEIGSTPAIEIAPESRARSQISAAAGSKLPEVAWILEVDGRGRPGQGPPQVVEEHLPGPRIAGDRADGQVSLHELGFAELPDGRQALAAQVLRNEHLPAAGDPGSHPGGEAGG